MALRLRRRPGPGLDLADVSATRLWLMERVQREVRQFGAPMQRIYLLNRNSLDILDLEATRLHNPEAHLGATFHLLRRRRGVSQAYLAMDVSAVDPAGCEHRWAVLFEISERPGSRRYWMAALEYRSDPKSGLGIPDPRWMPPGSEADDPEQLPHFLRPVAVPPQGARPAEIGEPSGLDLTFAFGEIPDNQPIPADARQMIEFAAALGSVHALLTERLVGSLVVRVSGRSWEQWLLGGELSEDLNDRIRWIANDRLPAAEGVALIYITLASKRESNTLGVRAVGEYGGRYVETWAPISLPEGPKGPKRISEVYWSEVGPVLPERRWLGVPSGLEPSSPLFD